MECFRSTIYWNRAIMDREVRDSLSSYYDTDDDGNGLWPGYELEI